MRNNLNIFFENLLEKNLIQYFTVTCNNDTKNEVLIKVYYPQIITKICKLLDKEFGIINRRTLVISREEDGYHATSFSIPLKDNTVSIQIWGVS